MKILVSSLSTVAFFCEEIIISHWSLVINLYVGCAGPRTLPLKSRNSLFLHPSSFFLTSVKCVTESVAELPSSYGSQKSGMKVLVKLRVN
jgi:hypothetical protein